MITTGKFFLLFEQLKTTVDGVGVSQRPNITVKVYMDNFVDLQFEYLHRIFGLKQKTCRSDISVFPMNFFVANMIYTVKIITCILKLSSIGADSTKFPIRPKNNHDIDFIVIKEDKF